MSYESLMAMGHEKQHEICIISSVCVLCFKYLCLPLRNLCLLHNLLGETRKPPNDPCLTAIL